MATSTVFQYTTGELKLALTKNSFFGEAIWEFPQDIENKASIIEIKTFKYGNHCGILKKLGHDKISTLRAKGDTWYLITKSNGKPFLKNTNPRCPDKINPKYIELTESCEDVKKINNLPIQLQLNLIWE